MNYLLLSTLFYLGLENLAHANGPCSIPPLPVPEMPSNVAPFLLPLVLGGAILVRSALRGRKKTRPPSDNEESPKT